MQPDAVMPIIQKYKTHRGGLIAILEEIQTKYGYLPEDVLRVAADQTDHALVDIYGVAPCPSTQRMRSAVEELFS
jgi:NADH-quinone oxidoreductase subunit E